MTRLVLAACTLLGPVDDRDASLAGADKVDSAERDAYHGRTRDAITEVAELPEFANLRRDSESWWYRFWEWLRPILERLGSTLRGLPRWLFWPVIAWLVLTLLAILGHFAYVLWGVIGSAAATRGAAETAATQGPGGVLGIRDLDFDTVYQRAKELLAAARWVDATKYLYVAAILWLDRQGCVQFKTSKTNCDYLAEMSRLPEHRNQFRKLTHQFESIVYGGELPTESNCQEMASLVEVLLREVTPVVAV